MLGCSLDKSIKRLNRFLSEHFELSMNAIEFIVHELVNQALYFWDHDLDNVSAMLHFESNVGLCDMQPVTANFAEESKVTGGLARSIVTVGKS